MTAHKHAEMIKAKADNMELVVFFSDGAGWQKSDSKNVFPTSDSPQVEYFLCHPKHKKRCLHWLNGGEYQFKDDSISDWDTVGRHRVWNKHSVFMSESFKFRVKPSKEKRWIGVNTLSNTVTMMHTSASECRGEITDEFMLNDFEEWQFIEIEVEV